MDNQIITVAYSIFINKGAFALLLGSGISSTSGIPTGWEITLDLINKIALLEKQNPQVPPDEWYRNYFQKEPDYSDILERLTNTPEERINLLKPYIEPTEEERGSGLKVPTVAHKQIAELVQLGYVRVIVTTNFDRLMENALKNIGIEPAVISNPNHVENTLPLVHSPITIIKINGDYQDTRFLNIKSELENYDARLVNLLQNIFENYGLITCGWSAKWDIALVDIMKSANKFRYTNYFGYRNKADEVLLALTSTRQGKLVKMNDADTFFTETTENLKALEKNGERHPLTTGILLTRLKKYLVKEEHRIDLHDLIRQIVEECFEKINTVNFSKQPTAESIKELMDYYSLQIEPLCFLVATGSYWANKSQNELFVNILRRVGTPDEKRNSTSWSNWNNLSYFPALVLKYACGIGCVAKDNISLLKQIVELKVTTSYGKVALLTQTNPWTVIEKDNLNNVNGTNWTMPMSLLLYDKLRPIFKELVPIDNDFNKYFDEFEFYNSLKYTADHSTGFLAIGKFGYQDRGIVDRAIENLAIEKTEFKLIKGGYFPDVDTLTKTLLTYKDELSKRSYH
ncbi:hypothetical protein GCM10028808_71040 [Spirosoma migulaei]